MRGREPHEPYVCDADRKVYITPAYFEITYGRGHFTVREWARRGKVRSFWHNNTLYVHLDDCLKTDADTPKRQRAAKEA